MIIAHVSDTHVDGSERNAERTRRVMRYLAGLAIPADVVLITGDVTDRGTEPEYEQARRLIDPAGPALFCPGNHDARQPFRKALLGEEAGDQPINRAYHVDGVLFAMCDSTIPGRHDGRLDEQTLDWLDAELTAAADMPAFVCFHHPPVVLGAPYIDEIRQFSTERLAGLVAGHRNVVAVLCGHAHTPAVSTFGGKPLIVAPGVASTVRLAIEGEPVIDEAPPPMVALHLLGDDLRLTTHYRVVL
nr:phosphodiesterase [uncultured Actinoplanes sp.]